MLRHSVFAYRQAALLGLLVLLPTLVACVHESEADDAFQDCTTVSGTAVATLSTDAGVTTKPNAETVRNVGDQYTAFAAPAGASGVVFAVDRGTVYRSGNGGCHWERILNSTQYGYGGFLDIAATSTHVFVVEAGQELYTSLLRLDTNGNVDTPTLPAGSISSLATTPDDPDVIYVGSRNNEILRSVDQGETWAVQASSAPIGVLHINPRDQLHMIVDAGDEINVSFDGGITWTNANIPQGNSEETQRFQVAFDGGNDDVWASAERVTRQSNSQHEPGEWLSRQELDEWVLMRSTDGGVTFHDAISDASGLPLVLHLIARPGVAGELLFTAYHRTYTAESSCVTYSPFLYRYQAGTDTLSHVDNSNAEGRVLKGLFFDPVKQDRLYLGNAEGTACTT